MSKRVKVRVVKPKQNIAKKALKIAQQNKKSLIAQRSNHDISLVSSPLNTSPDHHLLNGLVTGDTEGTRIGNSISITGVSINGSIQINQAADRSIVRLMLVYDRATLNSDFDDDDLLVITTSPTNLYTYRRTDSTKRFRVLMDRKMSVSDNAPQIKFFNIRKRFKTPLVTKYSLPADNTVSAINTGSLYLVAFSSEGVNTINFSFYSRLMYEI